MSFFYQETKSFEFRRTFPFSKKKILSFEKLGIRVVDLALETNV